MLLQRRFTWLAVLIVVVGMMAVLPGCIIFDDDDDDDASETITVINETGYTSIRFYVDSAFYGNIGAYGTLSISGDFDGTRYLYAENDQVYWEQTVTVSDDSEFTWYLRY